MNYGYKNRITNITIRLARYASGQDYPLCY